MLTILTPTGSRPEAFAICQQMMLRQTYRGPAHWIVVDDGVEPQKLGRLQPHWRRTVLRPEPLWSLGQNTQGRNLRVGLAEARKIAGEDLRLLIVEDDDWYAPDWIETVNAELDSAELVGEGRARYYNVRTRRANRMFNEAHASLRASAMRGAALDTFVEVLAVPNRYYDMKLWNAHKSKSVFFTEKTVGMKGMPGRIGIAEGHNGMRGRRDDDTSILRHWIGDDADLYAGFYEGPNAMTPKDKEPVVLRPFRYGRRSYQTGEIFRPEARIDLELHIHARKVALRDKAKPVAPSRPIVAPKEIAPADVAEPQAAQSVEAAAEHEEVKEKKPRKKLTLAKDDAGAE